MCVALSKAIVLAAIAVQNGDAAVPEVPSLPPDQRSKKRLVFEFELSYKQYRRLRRRMKALEGMMRE